MFVGGDLKGSCMKYSRVRARWWWRRKKTKPEQKIVFKMERKKKRTSLQSDVWTNGKHNYVNPLQKLLFK